MKKNLGKIIFFLFGLSSLFAEDFSYKVDIDNPTPYLKEGTILTLEINQTNPDVVLLFNFDIKKSANYEAIRLDSREHDDYHNTHIKYIYLLYPLKEGNINIEFNLLKKVTNDDSITYSYSGDRDNVKNLLTKDTKIELSPINLNVKSLPQGTAIVGDFRLTHTLKKHQAKAYEPISFNLTIEGVGYPPLLNTILPKKGEFIEFKEKPIVHSKALINGYSNKVIYPLAISAKKSFTLLPIEIKAFNPKSEKTYSLTIPKQKFEIEKVAIENLIDKTDTPTIKEIDFSWIKTFLSYLLVFIVGYFTAIGIKKLKKEIKKEPENWRIKIKESKDEKSLLQLLISLQNRKFDFAIEELESSLYKGKSINLKKIKDKLIKI